MSRDRRYTDTSELPLPGEHPDRPKKKKKRGLLGCATTALTAAVILCFSGYSAISLYGIHQTQSLELRPRKITNEIAEPDPKIENILLVEADAGDKQPESVMLLSISGKNHTMTLIAFEPDTYVSIPNHSTNTLAAAYESGITTLMDTIVNNYGIAIDTCIQMDLQAVVNTVDAIGGLRTEVSDEEAERINQLLRDEIDEFMQTDEQNDLLPSGGSFVLNGRQAAAYTRIRDIGGDQARIERQQTIIKKILQRMRKLHPQYGIRIVRNAAEHMQTNLTGAAMYRLSLQMPYLLLRDQIQTMQFPTEGTYSRQQASDGKTVLAVDFDANLQAYLKAVNEETE